MSWITRRFEYYFFRVHAGTDDLAAQVFCKSGNETVAILAFYYKLNATRATISQNGATILLSYPAEQLHTVMEILRQERPLAVHYLDSSKWGYLTSGFEPVGEEEGIDG
ncbi:MAG: hypothetical protein AAFP08_10295 [Bacteroidota bacterium]